MQVHINNKKISIITINKDNKCGLEKTIQSVVSQTYFDKIEFIVIDGNSSDGSKEILDPSLYYYTSESDSGIFNAMNKGIKQSNSEYSLFLNSGDYLISNAIIEEIYHLLNTFDIISFPYIYYPSKILRRTIPSERLLNSFFSWTLPHHSTFIKTSLLKTRLYDESFNIMGDADLFFDLLIMKNCSYATYNNVVSYVDDSGISKQKAYEIRLERKKLFSKYSHQLNNQIIDNYLSHDNIDKIYVGIIEYEKLTELSLASIKNQSYSNIEICDYKKIEKLNSVYFIIINYDTILSNDYIKDLYNQYIFRHSFNRCYERSDNYTLNNLYFKK